MKTVSIEELLTTELPGFAERRRRRRRWALGVATATVLVAAGFIAPRELGTTTRASIGDGGPAVHVTPLVAGRVARVHVTDRQPVRAGDVLIEIDPGDFAAALAQALASVAEARGRLEQARWQLLVAKSERSLAAAELVAARDRGARAADARAAELEVTLAEIKQAAAEAQVEFVRAQINTAAAGVMVADVAAERVRKQLAQTQIRAPRAGRVTTTRVAPGDYVQVGQELLALGSDGGRPEVANHVLSFVRR